MFAFITLLVGIALDCWAAFVASVLYKWFVVTKFSVPPLSTLEMFGIILLVGTIRGPRYSKDAEDSEYVIKSFFLCAALPLLNLILGAIVRAL